MPNIQFSEKELEDYLCADDGQALWEHFDLRFVARQVKTSLGIIDILAYCKFSKTWVIVELKLDKLDYKAFFQAQRYKHFCEMEWPGRKEQRKFVTLLVGSNLSEELFYSVRYFNRADYQQERRPLYGQNFYRLFAWNFEDGISFEYQNAEQTKIEDGEY